MKEKNGKRITYIISTALLSLLLFLIYRVSLASPVFPYVMWSYMVILTVLVVLYILYNRGFSRKGITVDMLPDEWDDDKKQSFVEDADKRLEGSKWMLVLIISFLLTFFLDAVELFVIDKFIRSF